MSTNIKTGLHYQRRGGPEVHHSSPNGGSNHYGSNGPGYGPRPASPGLGAGLRAAPPQKAAGGFDAWPLIESVLRKWPWMFLAGVLLAGAGAYGALQLFQVSYTAIAYLIRLDTPNTEFFKDRTFTEPTFASLLRTPELLKRVGDRIKPPLPAEAVGASLTIAQEKNSDIVAIAITGPDAKTTVEVANAFTEEAIQFCKLVQAKDASEMTNSLRKQMDYFETERRLASEQIAAIQKEATGPVGLGQETRNKVYTILVEKLQAAREELINRLVKYTEEHPLVKEQQGVVAQLEKQLSEMTASMTNSPPRIVNTNAAPTMEVNADLESLRSKLMNADAMLAQLALKYREVAFFADAPLGYVQLHAPATMKDVAADNPIPKIILLALVGAAIGIFGTGLLFLGAEVFDDRLKTMADVERVTKLPVLASLGDLHKMDPSEQEHWAFRTWTALQCHLSPSPNQGFVCGITSARAGEGRTTWVSLLSQAASQCGFRVLTVGTLPSVPTRQHVTPEETYEDEAEPQAHPDLGTEPTAEDLGLRNTNTSLTMNVLSSPAQVTEKLTGAHPEPFVHIPLPGWVWSLDRRKQWQGALAHWSRIENIVILVELPPSSLPESVLLAENLPNLLWLADSGNARASETRAQLATLRNARCNLVGAVMNHEPAPPLKARFQRWVGSFLVMATLGWASSAQAQAPAPVAPVTIQPAQPAVVQPAIGVQVPIAPDQPVRVEAPVVQPLTTNLALSVTTPGQRGRWQQRFTLGPGDILNFGMFGHPELVRAEVPVGPDGRVSYLQAQDVMAAGLTVDELRARFDEELGKFYRSPRTIITPVTYNSKKYYMLGKVMTKGVFNLDRPLTLVEALARARGLESGLLDGLHSVDLADLQKSFLIRDGKRLPVDFEKLFNEGDLTQNVAIEPEDFIYFAPTNLKEVYVLGEVNLPGPVTLTANTTVIGAISTRGGFADKAYRSRVLVVRGSLNRPETFVIDAGYILDARGINFKLESKDIVYVSRRPFAKAEELLDQAATAFIQSTISTWTGKNIGPFINKPILPTL